MSVPPCPVCGSAAEIVSDGARPDDGYRFVRCTSVTSCEETDWFPSEREALEAWTTPTATPPATLKADAEGVK